MHDSPTPVAYYQNVRGLNTKLPEIYNALASCHYDIIAFSETFLNDSVHNSEISNNNYTIYRSDRKYSDVHCQRGGGVLLAVKSNFASYKYDFCNLLPF